MRNGWKKAAAVLAALVICMAAAGAAADTMHREADDPDIEMTAEIGWQGLMTYGKAMPLRVRIRNSGAADLEGKLGINGYLDSRQYNRYEMKISVPSGAEQVYVLPFSVMTQQKQFTPEITVDGKVAEAVNITLADNRVIKPSAMLAGLLSDHPQKMSGMNFSSDGGEYSDGRTGRLIPLDPDTFPDQVSLLDSFGILVIDNVDPAKLSAKQQETLNAWIEAGHIVLCSGTEAVTSWFSGRTGLEITGTEESAEVIPKLEELTGAGPYRGTETFIVSRMTGAEPLVSTGSGCGLVFRTEAGNGRIYTAAFELGNDRLYRAPSMTGFWRDLLDRYDGGLFSGAYSSGGSFSSPAVYPGSSIAIPVSSPMLPAVLVCAGAVVLGFALWQVLKKSGKQTWMWLGLPALAVAAAAVILVIAGSSGLNRPMVTYIDNMIQYADGSGTRHIGVSAASSAPGVHSYGIDGMPISAPYIQYVSDEPDYGQGMAEPSEMAMCYTAGEDEKLEVRTRTPWETTEIRSDSALHGIGRIDGEIWMQEDGLHGEIRNGTSLAMKPGKVVTSYGYVSVPGLEPGGSAAFFLKETPPDPSVPSGYDMPVPKDGEMNRNAGLYINQVVSASLGLDGEWPESGPASVRLDAINTAADALIREGRAGAGSAVFMYSAEAEKGLPLTVRADGEPAGNAAGITLLNAEIVFLPVGRTGVVCLMPGTARAVLMTVDENGLPDRPADSAPAGFKLDNEVYTEDGQAVFRFSPGIPPETRIDFLNISVPEYYGGFRGFLLNAETGVWEEFVPGREVRNPKRYLGAGGELFCRLEPDGQGYFNPYVPVPDLSMEGRAAHAAD